MDAEGVHCFLENSMKAYFAGPDVFRSDAHQHFEAISTHARRVGLHPVVPFDTDAGADGGAELIEPGPDLNLEEPLSPLSPLSLKIYRINILKIDASDLVIANMNAFRGSEPDSGTVFEVGYGVARGKQVILYGAEMSRAYIERVAGTIDGQGRHIDEKGLLIEDFSLPLNLMLAHSANMIVEGTVFDAIDRVAQQYLVNNNETSPMTPMRKMR